MKCTVKLFAIGCTALVSSPCFAQGKGFSKIFEAPILETAMSQRSAVELERCLALGISEWLMPFTLRGEGRIDVIGSPSPPSVFMAFTIKPQGNAHIIELRAPKALLGNFDGKATGILKQCVSPEGS